jgi:Trp operon repressor
MQMLDHYCRDLARFLGSALSSAGGAHSIDELAHVLRALLTPAEIESIAQRLSILDGISTGIAQREIAETLRVGIATVTRGSRVWQENRACLGKYFPRQALDGSSFSLFNGHQVVSSAPSLQAVQAVSASVPGSGLPPAGASYVRSSPEPEATVS